VRHRFAASAAVALAVMLLSACRAPMDESAPPPLPEDVAVVLWQWRSDVAVRQAQVQVHNGTEKPIEISDVVVTDPRFADAATRVVDRVTTVPAGVTVDIRIQLPEMACDVTEGEPTVQLTFVERGFDDRREGPLIDTLGIVSPMHERECRADALADAAAVELASFEPSPAGSPADLVLEIAPTGEAAASIDGILSTNLLTFGDLSGGTYPLGVEITVGDSEPTTVHLPLVPWRCDPHAVQEDKRGTVFPVDVVVDGEPGVIQLAAPEEMRGRILTWVADWCGFGEG